MLNLLFIYSSLLMSCLVIEKESQIELSRFFMLYSFCILYVVKKMWNTKEKCVVERNDDDGNGFSDATEIFILQIVSSLLIELARYCFWSWREVTFKNFTIISACKASRSDTKVLIRRLSTLALIRSTRKPSTTRLGRELSRVRRVSGRFQEPFPSGRNCRIER